MPSIHCFRDWQRSTADILVGRTIYGPHRRAASQVRTFALWYRPTGKLRHGTLPQVVHVGRVATAECIAPNGEFAAVFEDGGETGRFYAVDGAASARCVQVAARIYTVESIVRWHERLAVKAG